MKGELGILQQIIDSLIITAVLSTQNLPFQILCAIDIFKYLLLIFLLMLSMVTVPIHGILCTQFLFKLTRCAFGDPC